ncbi:hypothetical protein HanHA300_Chr10g0374191 [Helianthus annuus]|nr:hypothetical protein HanHA300_Chr10g0374191 [Helianthus annuus]KAJ0531015.1 hypothetical protein HanHA89_Chr10g0396411 [Helianthus annuus]KAJ0697865.1 hypothetical protein HanLR1_Chr10g0373801 [Helianthus annuus]KAJ0884932.1 hypothetical protein HanPSC8_Chr10g0439521 [Helianthus annuus]
MKEKERIWDKERAKLMQEREQLVAEGFRCFLTTVTHSPDFKGSLERTYQAYRNMGYQAGLKDGYSFSSQGMRRKETPHYNAKAKKQLSKLQEEFSGQTPVLIVQLSDNPLMSLQELKSLFGSADSPSGDSPSGCSSP